MKTIATVAVLVAAASVPALAADTISRKAGQWEVRTSIEGSQAQVRVVRQCIDAATDRMLQSLAGPFDPKACEQRNVQVSAQTTTIDFACTVAGKPATAHAVASGDFGAAYTMTVTAESPALPGGRMVMSMDAKWLGPCAADQKPGDVVLGNGAKVNILDMQTQAPPQQQQR
jgi:hypothetical protein